MMKLSYPEPENYRDDKCENFPAGARCRNLKAAGSKYCASCGGEIKRETQKKKREE